MGLYLRKSGGTYVRIDDGSGNLNVLNKKYDADLDGEIDLSVKNLFFKVPEVGFRWLDVLAKYPEMNMFDDLSPRLDDFDTLDTNYWTHREGTTVEVSPKAAYSGGKGLRLYYGDGGPWHADVQHAFSVKKNKVIVKVWWRNTSSDTHDPDRGGLWIADAINGKGVAGFIVYPDKIKMWAGDGSVIVRGSFTNVWVELGIMVTPENVVYLYLNGKIYGPYRATRVAGAVGLSIAGYRHEEHADVFRILEPIA